MARSSMSRRGNNFPCVPQLLPEVGVLVSIVANHRFVVQYSYILAVGSSRLKEVVQEQLRYECEGGRKEVEMKVKLQQVTRTYGMAEIKRRASGK